MQKQLAGRRFAEHKCTERTVPWAGDLLVPFKENGTRGISKLLGYISLK